MLDQLVASVRAGPSRALVLRGEAGVGKSALLEYLVQHAPGCAIARTVGVESEMELAYAGLQQLCGPFLDRIERLPGPQRDALGTAFGLHEGDAPDRFLVGLAVLSLFSDVAEDRPLVCVVDDAQWLDAASAQALAFAARRLGAESVGLVFAVREPSDERRFEGLPELAVGGLDDRDAHELLATVVTGPLDERVRDRIVAETGGNPLALLELPGGWTPAELAGGFGLLDGPALSGRIEQSFRERLAPLPPATRLLLLVAAAEPVGDPVLVWRAAAELGIGPDAAAPATNSGLVNFGAQVRFGHPLVRSAVYGAAAPEERQQVHRALAEATDVDVDPDRRAWHLAHATAGLDEDVAAELERSAGRARARGGLAAGAAFHERAAVLTPDPRRRAQRALLAAQGKQQAGAPDAAAPMTDLTARPRGRLAGVRDALTPAEWARAGAMAAAIIGLHVAGWGMLAAAAGGHYRIAGTQLFGFGTGVLAYTLGVRHAFDADHIAAIDNTTRKLAGGGQRPLSAGFFFSLGHCTVVFALAVLANLGIRAVNGAVTDGRSGLHAWTAIIGTAVSGTFLYLIAAPGIARRRQPGSMRTSPPNWSVRPGERGPAAAWRPGRHFTSARPG